jgi:predicted nucleic acid-binding Zn ribbon protein
MSFQSLQQVLGVLEKHDRWQKRQQFRQLVVCWTEVVGHAVSVQTRPLYIQRQVLQVATSNSAWAQNLAFERYRILEKLNARLPYPITDIRFSTAQWQSSEQRHPKSSESSILWQNHPSQISTPPAPHSPTPPANDPQSAFQQWATQVRNRSRHLPPCPVCHSPTPPGELQRWSVCALCAAKMMKR